MSLGTIDIHSCNLETCKSYKDETKQLSNSLPLNTLITRLWNVHECQRSLVESYEIALYKYSAFKTAKLTFRLLKLSQFSLTYFTKESFS